MRRRVGAVFGKELRDHLRDRRSLLSALLVPLFGPFLFAAMLTAVAGWSRQDKPLVLPVQGQEHAPSLMAHLTRAGVQLAAPPAGYEDQVREGKLDAVLLVPDDYAEAFRAGRPAEVQLVVDNSRNKARANVRRVKDLLGAYSGTVGAQRLIVRGVAPDLALAVKVTEVDLATPETLAASLFNMIPVFFVLACFVGGLNVAIDSTAGERERGSLEPLLLNPVARREVVLGKWLTTVLLAALAVTVCLVGFKLAVLRVPLQDLGMKVRLDGPELLGILAAVLPLPLAASALQMLVALFARSYKEAQTYLQFLLFLPMVPGFALALSPIKAQTWMYAVPVLAQDLIVTETLRGEGVAVLPLVLNLVGCLVVALLALAGTVRLLGNERIVFGRSS